MKSIIKFLHEANKLKTLKRAGWVKLNIENPESVADHTYRVALMGILFCPKELNNEKVLKMAIVHDLAETIVGDIITSHKDTIGFKKEKHEKEKKAIRHLVKDLDEGLSNEIISVWDEFEAQETEESKFAKQLDKLEMVFQAQEYDKNSEESFDSFWESTEYILKHPKLIEVFKELKKQR